jgi:hypothetical protein
MDDVALSDYIAGIHTGYVEAGRLDALCAALLGLPPCRQIWFSDYTLTKLRISHGDINYSHYRHMSSILLSGALARGRFPHLLEFWWADPSSADHMAFFVVLKATSKGEIFISTFHRVHARETNRLRKKALREGRLVREQVRRKWEA